MKKILSLLAVLSCTLAIQAQQADSTVFRAYLYNDEYDVYMRINLYDQDIIISWQDIYGPLPGFLAKNDYNFCWMITDSKVSGRKAELEMVNDYGSEDLTATLTLENDSLYVLRQKKGSALKVPNKGKWQKLPATLTFKKRK
ncbi:MAG: hypothetical protein ACSW8D_11380 [Prevotella sp.]